MKMVFIITVILMSLFSLQAMANEAHEKIFLIQIINQLEAIKPLIISAHQEQEKEARVKFHYASYRDANGVSQNGLMEDINIIEKGIQAKLHHAISEPRHFQAINGDYLNLKEVHHVK